MLFARTIRRKMVCLLALVLVMLVVMSLSGISGLMSYRRAVHDLDFSINHAPRRADLSDAIGGLFEPLLLAPPRTDQAAKFQADRLNERLEAAKERVADYRAKLNELPPTEANRQQHPVRMANLETVDQYLADLNASKHQLERVDTPNRHAVIASMMQKIGALATIVQRMPDYNQGLNETLVHARGVYQSRFVMVCFASGVVMLLFPLLVYYGYKNIFSPLRKLHKGAQRVAYGDFDYRLKLNSEDEMAELAAAFNKMTERFQEITRDLDRQVRERCKQLVRNERLAGIGFLAAGVAHEINNPLQAIGIASESLLGRMDEILYEAPDADREIVDQYLSMIQRESDRCQQITRKLLDFSRGQDTPRSRNDLTTIISEVLTMVGHMSRFQDREIIFERAEPCYVIANGPELKQVVLNIVANSLEAMDPGGTLSIEIAEETDDVKIHFQDNGCGMSPDTLDNLFEPFYTRRKDGKGTGLGMSISQRIIGDHGGTIEASSPGVGQGSRFQIQLPKRPQQAIAA